MTSAEPTSFVRASPAVDAAPPVTPNLVRSEQLAAARRIGRNTVETLVFRGFSTPIALFLVVLQSRFLHPAGRGAYILAALSVTLFARLLGQLGVAASNRLQDEAADVRALLTRALALGAALSAVGVAAIVGAGAVTHDVGLRLAVLASLSLAPTVAWQTVSGVLIGLGRVRLWNYVQMLSPLLTLLGMVVLVVYLGGGVRAAMLAWALANLLTAVFALAAARDLWLPLRAPPFDRLARTIAHLALVMGTVQVVNLLSYRIELFVLRGYEGLEQVGTYSIAVQTAESMWLVVGAIATAVTAPTLRASEAEAARLIGRAAAKGLVLTAAAALPVGLIAPFVIPAVFGHAFKPAVAPLALLLPGIVIYAPVTVLVVYLSVRRGRPRVSLAVSTLGLVVTTAAALVLIPALGSKGAALASSIGYAAGALLAWAAFARLSGFALWRGRVRIAG